jgi:hypothetical protein
MNVERFYEAGWRIYKPVDTQDGAGGVVSTYSLLATVSGRMRPLSGNKQISAEKMTYFADHRFYCAPTDLQEYYMLAKAGSTDTTYTVKHAADMMHMGRLLQTDCELMR